MMKKTLQIAIVIGAALFILALLISALVVPQLRVLHFLQAFIYVAVIALSRYPSAWGFGAGAAIALAWNCLNLFITHLMQAGAGEFYSFITTGEAHRLDTMMVFIGGIGHFILIGACLAGILLMRRGVRAWLEFAGGAIAALGYFAIIIAIAAPR